MAVYGGITLFYFRSDLVPARKQGTGISEELIACLASISFFCNP